MSEIDHDAIRLERDSLKTGHVKMCRGLGYCNESPEHGPGFEVPSQQELTDLLCGERAYLPDRIFELESFVLSCSKGEWFPEEVVYRAEKLMAGVPDA